jgi:hypothetical protein
MISTDTLNTIGLTVSASVAVITTAIVKSYYYKKLNIKSDFILYLFSAYRIYNVADKRPEVKYVEYINFIITSIVLISAYIAFLLIFIAM